MSRVAKLDSGSLDTEIHSVFWKDFQANVPIVKNKDEFQLLLETLVFFCGTRQVNSSLTQTYGSQLSGVQYKCSKKTLYLITILAKYLESKLSYLIFSSPNAASNKILYRLFQHATTLYSTLDLILFTKFLAGSSTFLSPLHRVLGVSSTTSAFNPPAFYNNTVYSQVEFQNRQLLWNAILEVFNMTLLSNAKWLNKSYAKSSHQDLSPVNRTKCAYCSEFPTNPYEISCCNSVFCYLCAVKVLEWSKCPNCSSEHTLRATPLY